MIVGEIGELWRYPVKSMAGEPLRTADLTREGIPGDRAVYVVDGKERIVSARTRPRLLAFRATLGESGDPLVFGRPWDSPEISHAVRLAAGSDARLVRHDGFERFDILPLLVATQGAISALGEDRRRLRPNLTIQGAEGLAERDWPGRSLRIGEAVIAIHSLRERCVITTFDPDTLAQDPGVLKRIYRDFGGKMALNCWVAEPGHVQVGDAVELLEGYEHQAVPPRVDATPDPP
ncbi:MAG: MOSC domain-containing protein [Rubrobacter sp.]